MLKYMSMTVNPYSREGSKKEQVSAMFDNIAGKYDFLNHFLSLGIDRVWRKRMVEKIKEEQPRKILDVATGTADSAIAIAKELTNAKVTGIDISPGMLAVGRTKIAEQSLIDRIELLDGDSENLQFEDATFDAVTVAFGVRNYENLRRGLEEMFRVLKPGGRIVVLEFSRPKVFPLAQLFNVYFKFILPLIGRLTSKDQRAYSYLYESVQAFPDGKDFEKELLAAGFKSTQCEALTFGICSLYLGRK